MMLQQERDMAEGNIISFPGTVQEPTSLAAMPGLLGVPRWQMEGCGWRLTVMATGVVACASVRRVAADRWIGVVSRSNPTGRRRWEVDVVGDGGSPSEIMRAAECAIAAMRPRRQQPKGRAA
jgi:hypothetical protein